jgi:hypothetical protein
MVGTSGSRRRALGAGDREGAQLACLDVGHAGVDVHEGRVDLAAEEVGQRRRAALVGDVGALGAGLLPEELAVRWSDVPLPAEANVILSGSP